MEIERPLVDADDTSVLLAADVDDDSDGGSWVPTEWIPHRMLASRCWWGIPANAAQAPPADEGDTGDDLRLIFFPPETGQESGWIAVSLWCCRGAPPNR